MLIYFGISSGGILDFHLKLCVLELIYGSNSTIGALFYLCPRPVHWSVGTPLIEYITGLIRFEFILFWHINCYCYIFYL